MPSFLGRRYQRPRDQVTGVEKGIGVFLLVLAAVITVTLLTTSRMSTRPLFALRPETNLIKPDPLLIVARSMMPTLGTAGWSTVGGVEVVRPEDLPSGEADASSFGVQSVYRGRYTRLADPHQHVAVTVYDVGDPAHAFGLCHARRPEGAEPLHVGCAGWVAGEAGGFWAGRYYTQFDRSSVQAADPTIRTIADTLAGVQLRYGPPFAAEQWLPAGNRTAGSFRFVAQGAAGFDFLRDAFLADYADGVTGFVTDCRDALQADRLIGLFVGFLEERGRVQARPAPPASPLLAGDSAGRQLVVFAAGNRVYGAVGSDMDSVAPLVKDMMAGATPAAAATATGAGPAPRAGAQASLPDARIEDWGPPVDVRVFTPENLWEKIDGRADVYLAYRMVDMTFGTYRAERDPEQFIDVYAYNMGSPENAFGIYRAERPPAPEPVDVGREGYATPGGVFFWKGEHYVRVEAADDNVVLAEAAAQVARALDRVYSGSDQPLWADAMLPAADRNEGSFEYHAADAFSLDFLSDVFSARYTVNGETFQTFIHRGADAAAARGVFDSYEAFFKDFGSVLRHESGDGYELLIGESGGVIDAVFVKGRYVGGVSGCPDADLAGRRCAAFARAVTADEPG